MNLLIIRLFIMTDIFQHLRNFIYEFLFSCVFSLYLYNIFKTNNFYILLNVDKFI